MRLVWIVFFLLLLLSGITGARAQTEPHVVPGSQSTANCPGSNTPCWTPYSATNPLPTTPGTPGAGSTGTPVETTVTCGVGTTALLAASTATTFILIKNPAAGGIVWINFAGVAAVAAPPSVDLAAGQSISWSALAGYVPTSALNCIAPVAQAVSLVYK